MEFKPLPTRSQKEIPSSTNWRSQETTPKEIKRNQTKRYRKRRGPTTPVKEVLVETFPIGTLQHKTILQKSLRPRLHLGHRIYLGTIRDEKQKTFIKETLAPENNTLTPAELTKIETNLKSLQHQNLIPLIGLATNAETSCYFLLFPYSPMRTTLHDTIYKSSPNLTDKLIYIQEIIKALNFLHEKIALMAHYHCEILPTPQKTICHNIKI